MGKSKTILINEDGIIWDDLRIVPGAFQFLGSGDPTLQDWVMDSKTFKVYTFVKNDAVYASCQMPHSYKEGSDLRFHIHWTPKDRGSEESGNLVGWKVDYSIADVMGNFVSAGIADLSDACSGEDDRHEISASVNVDGTGLHISHVIMLKIYRSDTGTDDTWVGTTSAQSPAILEFDIHFQKDQVGSLQETSKT